MVNDNSSNILYLQDIIMFVKHSTKLGFAALMC